MSWGSKDKDGLKCGAGKKRSFQVGAIEWVGHQREQGRQVEAAGTETRQGQGPGVLWTAEWVNPKAVLTSEKPQDVTDNVWDVWS